VRESLPRAYFANEVKWGAPHESVLEFIAFSQKSGFDPARLVILEHNRPGEKGQLVQARTQSGGSARVEFAVDQPDRVKLHVSTDRDNYLVLADTFFPGWTATVDSKPSEIFRANAMMRSVFVPTGTHDVVFNYSPDSFKLGLALALIGGIAITAALAMAALSSMRKEGK
jgi:hypothetical protein